MAIAATQTQACLADVRHKIQVDEAGHQAALARLKRPAPQAVPHLQCVVVVQTGDRHHTCASGRSVHQQRLGQLLPKNTWLQRAAGCLQAMCTCSPACCSTRSPSAATGVHAAPHQADFEAQGQHKGGQQAAHPHIVSPRALALRGSVHRHKPDDEQDAPHLGEGGEVEAGGQGRNTHEEV